MQKDREADKTILDSSFALK